MKKTVFFFALLCSINLLIAQSAQTTSAIGENTLFRQGKELFAAGNFKGCITQLEKYKATTNKSDKLEEVDYMLAASAFETEDMESQEQLLDFLTRYPYSLKVDRARFLLGTISFIRNNYKECIKRLTPVNKAVLSSIEQQDYQYRLAYSYLTVDSAEQARNIFRKLTHNSTKYGDAATYYTAWYDYKDKEFDRAQNGFEAIKKLSEFSENANFYLAQIQFIRHEYDATIQAGEAIFDKMKNSLNKAELARILGESYYHKGEISKAIDYLTEYAEKDKAPLAGSMYILGSSWFAKQDYPKAIQYLKFATTGNDELAQSAYYYLGCSYLKLGDKKNARLAFEISSKSDFNQKTKELALYNYAMLIYETAYTGFNESVTIFEQFLNLFPESSYADKLSDYLSEVYMTSKNYPTALASIEKIKHPNSKILDAKQRILFQIGVQEIINGNSANGKKNLLAATEMGKRDDECYAEAHYWLGEISFSEERFGDAVPYFQSYASNTSGNNKELLTLGYYNLGYSYFKMQVLGKAQNAFEKALSVGCKKNPMLTADILNRLGDCRYYQKDYAVGQNYYARAAQTSEVSADYSLFQQALILGLQKQYNSEIKLLDKIISDFQKSDYQDDALFEKANTYQNTDRKELAIKTYTDLLTNYPKSSFNKSAAVQLGMLYLGMNNVEKSIEWYKYAITTYPGSDEANVANEDLKRVYKDNSRIGEYVQFLKTLNGKVIFTASEQDSLMYMGAEKSYMKGNKSNSERSFIDYLKEFPDGVFSLNANYYLAMIHLDQKKDSLAISYLDAIIARPENKFTETALSYLADIEYNRGNFEKAYNSYKIVEQKTESSKKRTLIWGKMLDCTWVTKKQAETINLANQIIDDPKSDAELVLKARYYRAKSNIELQKTENLANDLTILSTDTRTAMGAEAKYLLANYYFETNNSKKAESEIFDYIDKGTPHQHWLARSFILLTDIYIKDNDLFQAKQYLNSLKNNYKEKDIEIEKMIEERLPKVQ